MVDPTAAAASSAPPDATPDDTRHNPAHHNQQEQDDTDDDDVTDLPRRQSTKSPDPLPDIQASLRQRRSANLKASFNTAPTSPLSDSQPHPRPQRRSSSFASQTSAASSRPSIRQADSFFAPGAPSSPDELHADHEPTLWQSAPLLLAVLPAILGVAFKKGSILVTDLALLCLAAVYLNWCLVTPWNWYREARAVAVVTDSDQDTPDAEEEAVADDLAEAAKDVASAATSTQTDAAASATRELRLHELAALTACFLGPLAGAYLLHALRTSLSTFGDELVSNMHLTLFVLGAELRPARHAVKLVHARTLHLQRIVRADAEAGSTSRSALRDQLAALQSRVDEVEASLASSAPPKSQTESDDVPTASIEGVKAAQASLQAQVDALTRAVRRYEKRATAQTLQSEAALAAFDARLRDALALAAAAARDSQKGGVLAGLGRVLALPFLAVGRAVMVPLDVGARVLVRALEAVGFVRKAERRRVVRRPVRREKGAASVSASASGVATGSSGGSRVVR